MGLTQLRSPVLVGAAAGGAAGLLLSFLLVGIGHYPPRCFVAVLTGSIGGLLAGCVWLEVFSNRVGEFRDRGQAELYGRRAGAMAGVFAGTILDLGVYLLIRFAMDISIPGVLVSILAGRWLGAICSHWLWDRAHAAPPRLVPAGHVSWTRVAVLVLWVILTSTLAGMVLGRLLYLNDEDSSAWFLGQPFLMGRGGEGGLMAGIIWLVLAGIVGRWFVASGRGGSPWLVRIGFMLGALSIGISAAVLVGGVKARFSRAWNPTIAHWTIAWSVALGLVQGLLWGIGLEWATRVGRSTVLAPVNLPAPSAAAQEPGAPGTEQHR